MAVVDQKACLEALAGAAELADPDSGVSFVTATRLGRVLYLYVRRRFVLGYLG